MRDREAKTTRCLLVQPRFSSHSFWNYSEVCRFVGARYPAAPLGLMTVAALLPQQWQLTLVDENVRPLTDGHLEWADLVLVSGMLPQQKGILTVMQRAHDKGRPVVVGGPDATSQPQLYRKADYLVLGEGEVTIPPFIEDLSKHARSGEYRSPMRADMARAVVPRFDLIRFADYLHVGIQFSRGCPFACEFCDIIELFGRKPRTKSPEQMVTELQALYDLGYRGHVDLVDDNLIGNKSKVKDALRAMSDWSRRHGHPFFFSTEASINLAAEEELLQLMQENDFRYVFVGIESPDEDVLAEAHKTQNRNVSVVEAVRVLAAHGMIVDGGFVLGFDRETETTAGNMIHLIQDAGICMAMVGTLSALPNTQLSRRLTQEGRLFHGGQMEIRSAGDIDQTTSGLNFSTIRPRTAILRDQAEVLRQVYDPAQYYERVLWTATHLRPAHKTRSSFWRALKMMWAFLRVSVRLGFSRRTGFLYGLTLFKVLTRNPRAIEAAVNLAAMYVHLDPQSRFVIDMLETKIAYVESHSEEQYNAWMTMLPGVGERAEQLI